MKKYLSEILTLESLKIGYQSGNHKNVLLPPLNANACKGELIAVIGRNGIGKSTLLRTLTGLQPAIGGEIYYNRKSIKDHTKTELAQKVGYISTEILKISNMSVYDLVSLGRFPHTNWIGRIDSFDHGVIIDAIAKTGMSAFGNRYISELSDGERQKAMIARILAQDTGIMVMDEPTAFLDIRSQYDILHLLHVLSQENEKTIIFSTHDLHMAISQSDKIWLILEDKLIEGAPEDLMMKGAFDHLFDPSHVQFNSDDGTFSFRREERGSIFLEGDGKIRHWTEKAINRAGYSLSETMTNPYIRVPVSHSSNWQLLVSDKIYEFGSIYELVGSLVRDNLSFN
jgi:iron complex transport system ATP-binding protein